MTGKRTRTDRVKKLVLMGLLTAVMVVLGYVNIPMPFGLSITFNMIPVAIGGIAMGLWGGTAMGAVFGMISFLQCFGICGSSGMGAQLVAVAPWWMSYWPHSMPRAFFTMSGFSSPVRGSVPSSLP